MGKARHKSGDGELPGQELTGLGTKGQSSTLAVPEATPSGRTEALAGPLRGRRLVPLGKEMLAPADLRRDRLA